MPLPRAGEAGGALGAITRSRPSFAHSSSRRSAWRGRPQPAREPDLAEDADSLRAPGTPRAADAIASATARSAPGSSMRTPPATLTKTSARAQRDTGMAREDGDDHRQPLRVDAGRDPPGHREVGARDERLDLEQERPRPLERTRDGSADLARVRAAEELGGIRDADEPGARHLEHAQLVRRAEPVLRRAEDAVRVVAVALELEHAVDEMLEHAWPGHRSVLRHVPDEDRRHTRAPSRRAAAARPPRAPVPTEPGAEPSSDE